MKNFEKYEEKILELVKDGDSFGYTNEGVLPCAMIDCHACIFRLNNEDQRGCDTKKTEWLYKEYVEKPKLNKAERAFCESVKTGWIARYKNNVICLYTAVPYKKHDKWCSTGMYFNITMLEDFNSDLTFEFIKWEDDMPWKIADLLELEIEE